MTKAIVLHSGGLDSTVVLALAIQECGKGNVATCRVWYGSTHAAQELKAADAVAEHYGSLARYTIQLPNIFGGSSVSPSALMGDIPMPEMTYHELHNTEGPSPTVVPFRNANLISIAVTLAMRDGYDYVYAGMHGEDAHNWAYPDCTPEFLGAMANAVYIGTYHKVRLRFPLIWVMKSDVVRVGDRLQVPFELTWSCYQPVVTVIAGKPSSVPDDLTMENVKEVTAHCGKCPTCIERLQAFKANNLKDPVLYAVPLW